MFDIVVSLYSQPSVSDRAAYETIFGHAAAACVVCELGGSPLQAVLEVDETADRLRMVLRRLREVKGQLGGK